jgi:hypothetical protein
MPPVLFIHNYTQSDKIRSLTQICNFQPFWIRETKTFEGIGIMQFGSLESLETGRSHLGEKSSQAEIYF